MRFRAALPPRLGSEPSELVKRILRDPGGGVEGAPLGLTQSCALDQEGWMRAP